MITLRIQILFTLLIMAALLVAGVVFIFGGRQQRAWDNPVYHRDPLAPRICMCYWMRSAFYVPCSDIPPELLKEAR